MIPNERLFRSFWMAGFECSCHVNSKGVRLDMIAAAQHDRFCAADYKRLCEVGIRVARDGLRWNLIERSGAYDWSSWIPMLEAAHRQKLQVIWDLFHYGWPDGIGILSPAFVDRFARFCGEAARVFREHSDDVAFYSPMNEISFFTWAATRELMFPYAVGKGNEIKRQCVRAAIAGIESIRAADSGARFISPEPLIHNVPPADQPWNTGPALAQRNSQFEAWDWLTGRAEPQLGGAEHYLDIVGVNFYAANEWEVPGGRKLHWDAGSDDPRWLPLHQLLAEISQRYQRPLVIAETSHYGIGRAPWLKEIASEARLALDNGVPLRGVCLYPILDRYDWEDSSHWHNCGLWDLRLDEHGDYVRELNAPYAHALQDAQALVAEGAANSPKPAHQTD